MRSVIRTFLFGGSGDAAGALLIDVVLNGLVLSKGASYAQKIIIGVIIVLAVAFDTFEARKKMGVRRCCCRQSIMSIRIDIWMSPLPFCSAVHIRRGIRRKCRSK